MARALNNKGLQAGREIAFIRFAGRARKEVSTRCYGPDNLESEGQKLTYNNPSFKALETTIIEFKAFIYSLPMQAFRFAPEVADDVFQDVCLKLTAYAGELGGMDRARRMALIRKITYTVCVDHYRLAARTVYLPDENILDILEEAPRADNQGDPQDSAVFKDMLRRAVGCLSEKQRRIFMMRFIRDMDISEIADTLNKTPLAVRQDLYRIRRRIQGT